MQRQCLSQAVVETQRKGSVLAMTAMVTHHSVLAAKAVETQRSVLAAKAVETQGKGSALPARDDPAYGRVAADPDAGVDQVPADEPEEPVRPAPMEDKCWKGSGKQGSGRSMGGSEKEPHGPQRGQAILRGDGAQRGYEVRVEPGPTVRWPGPHQLLDLHAGLDQLQRREQASREAGSQPAGADLPAQHLGSPQGKAPSKTQKSAEQCHRGSVAPSPGATTASPCCCCCRRRPPRFPPSGGAVGFSQYPDKSSAGP